MLSISSFSLEEAKDTEWLLSNGLGGYSSSTIIGMNTRKYHGLLIAPIKGMRGRHVFLSKLEETINSLPLSTNKYPNKIFPEGYKNQTGFSFLTHPVFIYSFGGRKLQKSVRMLHGKNTTVISYELKGNGDVEIEIRPLLSCRQIHSDPSSSSKEIPFEHDRFGFEIKKPAPMRMCSSFGKFTPSPQNYYNMEYEKEKERGYLFSETLFSPGFFSAALSSKEKFHICVSLEHLAPSEALEILDRQEFRLQHYLNSYSQINGFERTDFSDPLLLSADSFVCAKQKEIIAGFPWFSGWTRDTMISLPGILLSTGRFGLAREILHSYSLKMKDGLLPNFTDEEGNPHYNSSDASLWFLNAALNYTRYAGDFSFVKETLWKSIKQFLISTIDGNELLSVDSDCLISISDPASTWMDAKIDGKPVTPRKGKPVEINALWFSNLHFILELSKLFKDNKTAALSSQLIEGIKPSFQKFMHDSGLYDTIEPNDASIRPNQIFAVSLPYSPLNQLQQKHVFNIVRSKLYTPLGLRSLCPQDPNFHERYFGNQKERDEAYHQGAIWPWLLGAFYDAQLHVYPGSERQILSSLRPFSDAMKRGCINTIPEIYEPATGKPCGAISQAWSTAEILRIYTKVKKATLAQAGTKNSLLQRQQLIF